MSALIGCSFVRLAFEENVNGGDGGGGFKLFALEDCMKDANDKRRGKPLQSAQISRLLRIECAGCAALAREYDVAVKP
jgi:hypothetical protein